MLFGAVAAVWFGYGPLPMIPALAAHVYLHRMMTPRIPEFTDRGHPFVLRAVWYFLVVSLAVAVFATRAELLSLGGMKTYACISIPMLLLGSFYDDIRYARKMERESRLAA